MMEARHQRYWIILLAAYFLSPLLLPQTDGRQLFHKMQKALGGADEIAAIHDYEELESAQTWFENGTSRGTVHKRVRFIRPSYLRIDQVGPGDTYVLYCNGVSGWEILPDKPGVQELTGGELRFAQGYLNGMALNSWLNDRDPDIVLTSPLPNRIDISTKDNPGHINEITLDPDTLLPSSGKGISLADPDHPVRSETQFAEWKTVGAVKFPHRITNIHDGKRLAEITVEHVKLNSGLKIADLESKPPDLKPVMPH
jgi:hypothetical protein